MDFKYDTMLHFYSTKIHITSNLKFIMTINYNTKISELATQNKDCPDTIRMIAKSASCR